MIKRTKYRKGDYSIDDIKELFYTKFDVGDLITTTLNHPNGTHWSWYYTILSKEPYGYICQINASGGDYSGKDTWSENDYNKPIRVISEEDLKRFFTVL